MLYTVGVVNPIYTLRIIYYIITKRAVGTYGPCIVLLRVSPGDCGKICLGTLEEYMCMYTYHKERVEKKKNRSVKLSNEKNFSLGRYYKHYEGDCVG